MDRISQTLWGVFNSCDINFRLFPFFIGQWLCQTTVYGIVLHCAKNPASFPSEHGSDPITLSGRIQFQALIIQDGRAAPLSHKA